LKGAGHRGQWYQLHRDHDLGDMASGSTWRGCSPRHPALAAVKNVLHILRGMHPDVRLPLVGVDLATGFSLKRRWDRSKTAARGVSCRSPPMGARNGSYPYDIFIFFSQMPNGITTGPCINFVAWHLCRLVRQRAVDALKGPCNATPYCPLLFRRPPPTPLGDHGRQTSFRPSSISSFRHRRRPAAPCVRLHCGKRHPVADALVRTLIKLVR
jgi:hypothetical protein